MTSVYQFQPQVLQYVSRIVRQMSYMLYGDRYLQGRAHSFNTGPQMDLLDPNFSPFRGPCIELPPATPAPTASVPTPSGQGASPASGAGSVISSVAPPSKEYNQNVVNYAKKFQDGQGTFSKENLSKLYGFEITDKTIKNLDLDHNGKINLEEASAGLAFEDNNGAKADGKISKEDIDSTKSLFDQAAQGSETESAAKIKANQDTISKIDEAMDLKSYTK